MTVHWPNDGVNQELSAFDETRFDYQITAGPRAEMVFPPAGDGWGELDREGPPTTHRVLWRRRRKQ